MNIMLLRQTDYMQSYLFFCLIKILFWPKICLHIEWKWKKIGFTFNLSFHNTLLLLFNRLTSSDLLSQENFKMVREFQTPLNEVNCHFRGLVDGHLESRKLKQISGKCFYLYFRINIFCMDSSILCVGITFYRKVFKKSKFETL